jgi:hypothetical protein
MISVSVNRINVVQFGYPLDATPSSLDPNIYCKGVAEKDNLLQCLKLNNTGIKRYLLPDNPCGSRA